jgi:hypothetical protein
MMVITGEDDFVSRAADEWRNSSEPYLRVEFGYEEKLINNWP